MATSAIRRKPIQTYRSPSVTSFAEQVTQTQLRSHAPKKPSSATTRESSRDPGGAKSLIPNSTNAPGRGRSRKGPPLPLYHPLGPLALSLPELDPAQFGLPNRVNVDDGTDELQDTSRRSSSRARRPAAKVRDRDHEAVDLDDASFASPTSAPSSVREGSAEKRTSSPRKRRAAGTTGTKRKRKAETDDADGVFPPAAKRTRNPRGTGNTTPLVGSPLVSAAVAATVEDPVEDATPAPDSGEAEDAAADTLPEPKRSRTRKPRSTPANKRRNSSASTSTGTSVSVSIANTRNTRSSKARQDASNGSGSDRASNGNENENGDGEKKEEAEPEDNVLTTDKTDEDDKDDNDTVPLTPIDNPQVEEAKKDEEEKEADKEDKMDVEAVPAEPAPSPIPETSTKEEKEEGELSDEPDGTPAPIPTKR
ncbi:uncharacterized protein LAESUDRAFT_727813 [Laetiporus sulphureus 93-53]|uniref:Uncharacterized protein n=1 Tax=Laetiporus sulphureus 93-53 TaxID=1314785 RepID=A0A165DDI6_9APHY|nr:uncharacterized protein LAESUDRAFT_727813 [Laetiporus sulphureus 93-53]KZT04634.1 hypothetical protein LAESUDRAFT_727813 [Laetiporus sulphureus 93-53]